jgi:hypothetical protein
MPVQLLDEGIWQKMLMPLIQLKKARSALILDVKHYVRKATYHGLNAQDVA